MPQLGNNTTFNRGNNYGDLVVGYHSRTIFSYCREDPNNANIATMTEEANEDGIQWLIDTSGPNETHGTHIIPAYYWRPGKTFRISGTLIVGEPTDDVLNPQLNMRFGLNASGFFIPVWLAIQNDDNPGQSIDGNKGPLPIDFSCDIFCSYIDSDFTDAVFGASGYYQYDIQNYNSVGTNLAIYRPIWKSFRVLNGLQAASYQSSALMFNLAGTNIAQELYITQFKIEELA